MWVDYFLKKLNNRELYLSDPFTYYHMILRKTLLMRYSETNNFQWGTIIMHKHSVYHKREVIGSIEKMLILEVLLKSPTKKTFDQ